MAFVWLLLSFIFSLHVSSSSGISEPIVKLDEANFNEAILTHEYVLVNFRAPWCAPWCALCEAIYPEIEKAAWTLPETKLPVLIGQVNTDESPRIATRYGVGTVPDLRLFRNGAHESYYAGPTEANSLVRYLKDYVGPDVITLHSDADVIDFIESALPHFSVNVAFGVDKFNISGVAKMFKGKASFAHAPNVSKDLLRRYGIQKLPAVVSLHPTYGEQEIFYGDTHYGSVECFMEVNLFPLVVRLEENNMELLAHANDRYIVLTIMEDSETDKAKALVEALKHFAPPSREFILFAYAGVKQYKSFTDVFDPITNQMELPVMLIWKLANHGNNMSVVTLESIREGENQEHKIREFIRPLVIGYEREREQLKQQIYYTSGYWALKLKLMIFQGGVVILVCGHFLYKWCRKNRAARTNRPASDKDD